MDTKQHSLHVLMFPWLAHGHISPYLELAKKLSIRNFYISFCCTPVNLSSIRRQLDEKHFPSIQLVELHLPSLPNLPPPYHTTKSIPPHLMSTLKEAFDMVEPVFSNLLRDVKPDLLIYDYIQPWAPMAASREKIPAIHMLNNGAAASCCLYDVCTNQQSLDQFPFPSIFYHEHEYHKVMEMFNLDSNAKRFIECVDASTSIILIKTFREIEEKYICYLSSRVGKELVPLGPLVQDPTTNENESKFIKWLDGKQSSSVLFVSFGSEYFMSKEEIDEIAYGLELSKVNFIWVIRFPEGDVIKVDEALPQSFLDRIGSRGIVARDWAPQGKILDHPSIGGFVSHCGWSFVMEGIYYGVPIIAMPMHLDQPTNARLVVELGTGKEVRRQNKKFVREEISMVIKEVVAGKEREEIRRGAKELSDKVRKKGDEEVDVVEEKVLHICGKTRPVWKGENSAANQLPT